MRSISVIVRIITCLCNNSVGLTVDHENMGDNSNIIILLDGVETLISPNRSSYCNDKCVPLTLI